jgi:DNA polymerase-3 subunit epsilon
MPDKELKLSRPLVVFDLETTGLDVSSDRIVEISCVKIAVDGTRDVRTRRINPTIPISAAATQVHGITDEDIAGEPTFAQLARGLFEFLDGCDLSGFNVEQFDLPLLVREFNRVGMTFPRNPVFVIDSWKIFLLKEPRDLGAAYRCYCGKELVNAHSAEADTVAAADILLAQVARYDDAPADIEGLYAFTHPVHPDWLDPDGRIVWQGGEAALGFGKHRGLSLRRMAQQEPEYLRWIAAANFSDEVVRIVRAALVGDFPVRSGDDA